MALGLEVRNKYFYNTSNEEGKEKRREEKRSGNHVKILALFTLPPVPVVGIISIIIIRYARANFEYSIPRLAMHKVVPNTISEHLKSLSILCTRNAYASSKSSVTSANISFFFGRIFFPYFLFKLDVSPALSTKAILLCKLVV